MRFIDTSAIAVEKLKQAAKKLKQKAKITHAEALDRVARGAGYHHWGHVTQCAKESARRSGERSLVTDCSYIVELAKKRDPRIVLRRTQDYAPFALFSSEDGDAWLVSPSEELALCLCWRGESQEYEVREDNTEVMIGWDAFYAIKGAAFHVESRNETIGTRTILGYQAEELEAAFKDLIVPDANIRQIFMGEGTEELNDELINKLVSDGWSRENLEKAKSEGMLYSHARKSLIGQPIFG
jgi:hypothetical protein